jgi:hypothetical protein
MVRRSSFRSKLKMDDKAYLGWVFDDVLVEIFRFRVV